MVNIEYLMEQELKNAHQVLSNRGVILYPTDTIWGLGCNATDIEAINKIYEIKQRPHDKKFIMIFKSIEQLQAYCDRDITTLTRIIRSHYTPTTFVVELELNLPKILASNDRKQWAIRITQNEFCQKLCTMINAPLVSTSANVSGAPSPMNYDSIDDSIKSKVDYIVDQKLDSGTGSASNIFKLQGQQLIKIR